MVDSNDLRWRRCWFANDQGGCARVARPPCPWLRRRRSGRGAERDCARGSCRPFSTSAASFAKTCAIVATGYGRKLLTEADATITEISCQAAGVSHCLPQARTVIDIGGQDSKLLHLAAGGSITDFSMNDRCAAGTGRFLEVVAARMGVRLAGLGEMVSRSRRPAVISSMCVVFAETEIIGLLAQGATPEDIIAGVQASIAARVAAMAGRRVASPVVFTGGVALVPGMSVALGTALGEPVTVAPDPQLTCALGAAILAARKSS